MKLGANTVHDEAVDEARIDDWYRDGDSSVAAADLKQAFAAVFPNTVVEEFHVERCVITYSVHGRPYIDEVAPGLVVAVAGNGHGASWADGAGKLAAQLIAGELWDGFRRESFAAVYADESPAWPKPLLLRERI